MHIYHWMQLLDINIREQPQLSGYRMHLMVSQWVMGSNPIRVTGGGVRNDIGPQLLLCYKDKSVPTPAQKEAQFRISHM